jgi:Na+/phosphate symporter
MMSIGEIQNEISEQYIKMEIEVQNCKDNLLKVEDSIDYLTSDMNELCKDEKNDRLVDLEELEHSDILAKLRSKISEMSDYISEITHNEYAALTAIEKKTFSSIEKLESNLNSIEEKIEKYN